MYWALKNKLTNKETNKLTKTRQIAISPRGGNNRPNNNNNNNNANITSHHDNVHGVVSTAKPIVIVHPVHLMNAELRRLAAGLWTKGAITSKIKHAIKHKTSPARLAQLLQPSLAFCFSLQPMTAYLDWTVRCHWLQVKQNTNEGCNSCATVVQVL